MKIYDLVIIGAGPAGITAGIYAKNFGLDFLMIGEEAGGLINTAYKVENYPGIFNISGKDLTKEFEKHRNYLKISLIKDRVELIQSQRLRGEKIFQIFSKKKEYKSKSIILAFGTEAKKINIKDVEKFEGKGVSYCINDNTFLYKNKTVAIVGGANAAVMNAIALAEKAKKVYLIYRKDKLRSDAIWTEKIKKIKNIEIIYKTNVIEVKGSLPTGRTDAHGNKLEKIVLDNKQELEVSGILIEAGCIPKTSLIHGLGVKIDDKGYIQINKDQSTNVAGIFAAGDITTGSNEFRQIVTACSEAAIAVLGAFNFLKNK